jgi:hypothetical protein
MPSEPTVIRLEPMTRATTTLLLLAILLAPAPAHAAEEGEVLLMSGGMFYHLTPLTLDGLPGNDKALSHGLGGRLGLYAFRYLRLGGGGDVGTATFGELDSYLRTGHGGLIVEGALPLGPVEILLGALIGGQSMRVYDFEEDLGDGEFRIRHYRESAFIVTPLLSVEVTFIKRLKASFYAQYFPAPMMDGFYGHTVTLALGMQFNSYVKKR